MGLLGPRKKLWFIDFLIHVQRVEVCFRQGALDKRCCCHDWIWVERTDRSGMKTLFKHWGQQWHHQA